MIKKKCKAYEIIRNDIAKLAVIQEATDYSPSRLVNFYIHNQLIKKDREEMALISAESSYKYFCKQLKTYKKSAALNSSHTTMLELVKSQYLAESYFGKDYEILAEFYRDQENRLKDFVRDAYKDVFPITSDMTPSEVAVRNQKLGKISVKTYIGDVTNYWYFNQAPGFMMKNVQGALGHIDLFILRLLMDQSLHLEFKKLALNQKLEEKFQSKPQTKKSKALKI